VGQFERAADRQRLVAVALEPFLHVKIEARQPVVFICDRATTSIIAGAFFFVRILDFSVMQNTDRDADGS
jgi:hypothetical protein